MKQITLFLATLSVALFVLVGCDNVNRIGEKAGIIDTNNDGNSDGVDVSLVENEDGTVTMSIPLTEDQQAYYENLKTARQELGVPMKTAPTINAKLQTSADKEAQGLAMRMTPQMATPPPAEIWLCGDLINQGTYWIPNSCQNFTGSIVADALTVTFTPQIGRQYHLLYNLNDVYDFRNIFINGVSIDSYCLLGDPATWSEYGVASFIPNRNNPGAAIEIDENPNCTLQAFDTYLVASGTGSATGIVYTNPVTSSASIVNMQAASIYDASTGTNPFSLMTNYDAGRTAFIQEIPLLEGQSTWFCVYVASTSATAQPGDIEPYAGVALEGFAENDAGGATLWSDELVHWEDFDADPAPLAEWYCSTINGVDGSGVDQDPDNLVCPSCMAP
jgi:hypothetical protein